ncbi:MAG: DUF5676 family membrane protein, partial [Nanoarchaeota archaeon]
HMKLNAKRVGSTLAIVGGIISLACLLLIAIFKESAVAFFGYIFHGIDMSQIAVSEIAWVGALIGVVEVVVLSFVIGWLFTKIYNALA